MFTDYCSNQSFGLESLLKIKIKKRRSQSREFEKGLCDIFLAKYERIQRFSQRPGHSTKNFRTHVFLNNDMYYV